MIDLNLPSITRVEKKQLENLINRLDGNPSIRQIWLLMDAIWKECGCHRGHTPSPEALSQFYGHPIWLLNGIFSEQDPVSVSHRSHIVQMAYNLSPKVIVDFGGGSGTLACLLAAKLPSSTISIFEPFPSPYTVRKCHQYSNIEFLYEMTPLSTDLLVCIDVLEHVSNPLELLASMISTVVIGGHLIIANNFHPVISCHLPSTFHLRYTFNFFCRVYGLNPVSLCDGSHATLYRREIVANPWPLALFVFKTASRVFYNIILIKKFLSHLISKQSVAFVNPLHKKS